MYPILFTIGNLNIASLSIFLILAWCVFSFVFWKSLRDEAIPEERIFDLTFYATIVSLIASRIWYVIIHWTNFSSAPIKILALWVAPGFSLMAGILAGLAVMMMSAKRMKLRLGTVLDAVGLALPGALLVGFVGSFLDGGGIGRVAAVPWAVRYVGLSDLRHPYQLYITVILVIIFIIVGIISAHAKFWKWPLGLPGLSFFFIWSITIFALEYLKESDVYWYRISADQWEALVLFCATVGVWYAYTGGKFVIHEGIRIIRDVVVHFFQKIYAKFPKRRT